MITSKIAGIGAGVPKKVLTNFDLEKIVDTSDEWISTRTGIKERRVSTEDEYTSTLATEAGKKALEESGIAPEDVEMIILSTCTEDYSLFPSTACVVQKNLGLKNAAAFDLNAACSGFVYGLVTANSYIASGSYKNVLLIAADTLTKFVDWKDRTTCVLFGDGAASVMLTAEESDKPNMLAFELGADGTGDELLIVPGGGSKSPMANAMIDHDELTIRMEGQPVFKFAVSTLSDSLKRIMEKASITVNDINHFVFHQANIRILQSAIKKLGIEKDIVPMNLDRYGNTSSASIPLVLDELYEAGKLKRGDIIAMVGFGAGLTWASALIRY